MFRLFAIVLIVLGFAGAAGAQGIDPLPLIAQFESGGNPIAQNPNSSAGGLYGDINSTWATALQLCGCGTTTQYPNAASAPPSIQTAANAALINSQGLQPWLCAGCDTPFALQVAADGGPSAFQTSGLSTDPATYASLDTGTSLSDLLGGGATFGDGTTITSPGATTTSGGSGTAALPFEYIYDQIINGIMGQIDSSIQVIEGIAASWGSILLALAVAILGVRALLGDIDMGAFMNFVIRAALVIAFIQVGNSYYSGWVESFFVGLPAYFANAFSVTNGGGTPQQLFDQILNGWTADVLATWHSSPWSLHAVLVGGLLLVLTVFIVIPTLVAMFTVFLISTFLLLVMLTIGPLMALALLFPATRGFMHGYVNVMVTASIFALVVDIVLGIFSSILSQIMANFTPSGSPDTDLPGLFGLAASLLVCGFSMARLPRMVEAIGGGVAASLDTAGKYMAGGFAIEAGGAAASGAAAAARAL